MFPLVFLLPFVQENSQSPPLLTMTLETLLRYLSWIPIGYIMETSIIEILVLKVCCFVAFVLMLFLHAFYFLVPLDSFFPLPCFKTSPCSAWSKSPISSSAIVRSEFFFIAEVTLVSGFFVCVWLGAILPRSQGARVRRQVSANVCQSDEQRGKLHD